VANPMAAPSAFHSLDDLPLQPASADIWEQKYQLKDATGEAVDQRLDDTFDRVARSLAAAETTNELRDTWHRQFLWALQHGAIPAGRIIANAGADAHKSATSTINCTVSGTIGDSMDAILQRVHDAGLTLKAGAELVTNSPRCGRGAPMSAARVPTRRGRCPSWTSMIACA